MILQPHYWAYIQKKWSQIWKRLLQFNIYLALFPMTKVYEHPIAHQGMNT